MNPLQTQIHDLASKFADDLLTAVRSATLEDLTGDPDVVPNDVATRMHTERSARAAQSPKSPKKSSRLPRRDATEIAAMVTSIVGLLGKNPNGLRSEKIRDALGLQAKELVRPLKEAVEGRRVVARGHKRSTVYSLKTGGVAKTKPVRAAARKTKTAPKKPARKTAKH